MARGVNKVILIGNLGQEPETRYMPSGSAVTNIRLATNESWKDKETGEQIDRTEWHRIAFFNRLAEIAGEYLHKGNPYREQYRAVAEKMKGRLVSWLEKVKSPYLEEVQRRPVIR